MLTDEEVEAVCNEWRAKSARAKAAVFKKAERLRAEAHAAPPFLSEHLETWRLRSREVNLEYAESFCDSTDGLAAALEVATLEKLFSSPKVKAWESAYRVIRDGLSDPHIAADPEMRGLFQDLLSGLSDTADGGIHLSTDPDFGAASFLVQDFLVTPKIQKNVLSQAGRLHGRKPHINHDQATERLPGLWMKLKGKGMSKTRAAPEIAAQLGLSESTVRKKLQGM
ncbi:MAG: hypothetical protein JNK17_07720 [Hydrogenophaga sp.]|nr:hypothetical protein [Hydrogenophaga sp.]